MTEITAKSPVVAIGLDAADPLIIEEWIAQGYLQNLLRLRQQGAYGRLTNVGCYRAETAWTTFLTGCHPEKTGYWSPLKFSPASYAVAEDCPAYDFAEFPPFYALPKDFRVAIFDMPQTRLCSRVNGIQVLAWGAHSPLTPSQSQPAGLLDELTQAHGRHPALHKDYAPLWNRHRLRRLARALETGVARRAAICQDLLRREPWDLFLTLFGETHAGAHYLWHLSRPDHPLYTSLQWPGVDPLRHLFQTVDAALGHILAAAPAGAQIVVFSAHGMESNSMDLPSMLFLPELLYRFSFPGQCALSPGTAGAPVPPPIVRPRQPWWVSEVWASKHEAHPVARFCKQRLPIPPQLFPAAEALLGASTLLHRERGPLSCYQPAIWYRPLWPYMRAFALPSFSEGYVRINLQGRERHGIVPRSEYDAVCQEICSHLLSLHDPRSGQPIVRHVTRTHRWGTESNPRLPDADLIISWVNTPVDVVDSPAFGRIGPFPYNRSGSHVERGFLMAKGPQIVPGSTLPEGQALDLAPTLLALLGAPIPAYMDGKPLLNAATAVVT
jgi:predicted AlkP superfamily phosphohydrolase/phosphomutase